jgi:hypothetical protein
MRQATVLVALAILCGVTATARLSAQTETPMGFDPISAAQWPVERLELKNGVVYEGLIKPPRPGDAPGSVRFDIVRRPRGRPMFLFLNREFPAASIAKIDRLPDAERAKLVERLDRYQTRNVEELFDMRKLELKRGDAEGPRWLYDTGPWFRLESWTDEEMTRRTIVRIEQMFAAYGEILPPRVKPQQPLRILLYGSMRDYAEHQKKLGHRFENPAFYLPQLNLLAAGSELSAYAKQLEEVQQKHAAIRAQYDQKSATLPADLRKLGDDLEKKGLSPAERKATVMAAQRKWREELDDVRRRMDIIERSNNAQFKLVTKEMTTRLSHEAFHAYLENFVYPHDKHDVPRWLNEGLAQVFEDGLLEVGTLRLDAPGGKRLAALQADLRSSSPLTLAALLTADAGAFLVSHPSDAPASERHYLYSWGLAHYLAVRDPILETARLDRYVDPKQTGRNAIERFEALVGTPLSQFEAKWREEMLALKGPEK